MKVHGMGGKCSMEEIRSEYRQNLSRKYLWDGMCMCVYQVAHLSKKQWPRFAARPWPLVSQASNATPSPFKLFEKVKTE
jgi:hypothetical protein